MATSTKCFVEAKKITQITVIKSKSISKTRVHSSAIPLQKHMKIPWHQIDKSNSVKQLTYQATPSETSDTDEESPSPMLTCFVKRSHVYPEKVYKHCQMMPNNNNSDAVCKITFLVFWEPSTTTGDCFLPSPSCTRLFNHNSII